MPAHRLLYNLDILHEVFLYLRPPQEDDLFRDDWDGAKALAQCTRVCKTFHEPAARHLWSRLPSPYPFLEVLGLSVSSWGCICGSDGSELNVSNVGGEAITVALCLSLKEMGRFLTILWHFA